MANTTLQDLRNLLYDPPSSHLWKRLIGLVEGEPDDDLRTIAAQYVTPFLNDGWPDHLRLAPRPWWEAQTRGREVLCWPWVRGLDLSADAHKAAQKTLAHPLMDELTALSLTNAKLTERRLADLIQGARTASIHTLDASGNTLNTAGALQTLQANFPHLTTLTLRRNDLHDERAFDVAPLARLQLLDLSENPLTADTLRGLWFTQALGHVHTLLLAKAGLDETHAHGFAHIAAHGMPALRHLDLSGNSLSGGGLWDLADSPLLTSLSSLDLSRNGLFWRDLRGFTTAVPTMGLDTLKLDGNTLEDESIPFLLKWNALRDLQTLSLARNRITDRGAHQLAEAPWLGSLTRLDLSDNSIGNAGAQALRDALGARWSSVLILRGNTGRRPL